MKKIIISFGAVLLMSSSIASAIPIANDVTYNNLNTVARLYNTNISGFGNIAIVSPGQQLQLTGVLSWVFYDGEYCPGCIIQHYLSWVPLDNPDTVFNACIGSGGVSFGVRNFSTWINAPTTAGSYRIGLTGTWNYSCEAGLSGLNSNGGRLGVDSFSGDPGYASFLVNVESIPDPDPPVSVPEPGVPALLGIGLAGMGLARRKKKA